MMAVDLLQLDQTQYSTEHFLVQYSQAASPSAVLGFSVAGATITRQVSSDGWYQATLSVGANLASALQAFQNLPQVIVASPDFRVSISATPNDTAYVNQWALENSTDADIDAAQAWAYGTSTSVVVAVIDTGIDYNHVDLASNIWINSAEIPGNGIDDDGNGYVDDVRGWNFVGRNNNPMDDNGHGTHVAGSIGAVGNNGLGITGVAWNVQLMALKFLDASGSGMLSNAVAAIDYARVNGAKVINASWGGGGFSSALQAAIQRFQNVGGIFVAAAGNEASNNALRPSYPANYTGVISVAASTLSDTLASFSNFGTNVQIAAPGHNILSTIPGNRYASYSGTSMAAPHVAGALALLWGQSPGLTATQLVSLMMANTDPVLTTRTQYGRLNLGKAAAALHGASEPTVPPASPTFLSPTRTGPIALADASRFSVGTTRLAIDVVDSFTILDVNVNLSINHTYVSDLRISLIAPDGTSVLLLNRRGGASDNVRVTFDDEAAGSIASASLLSGSFRPERSLSSFDGKNTAGRWILEVVDAARLDAGTLNSVQLQFTARPINNSSNNPASNTSFGNANFRLVGSWLAALDEWLRRLNR